MTNVLVDPTIKSSANWTIANATVDVYGTSTEVYAKSTGIPVIRSTGANSFTVTAGQQVTADITVDDAQAGSFDWLLRLRNAAGVVEQQTIVAGAVQVQYTAETDETVTVEITTTATPGSSSYYIFYDAAAFTLEVGDPPPPVDPPAPTAAGTGIYRDVVTLTWDTETHAVPAAVWPLGVEQTVSPGGTGSTVVTRYRIAVPPVLDIPAYGIADMRIAWGGFTGDGALFLEGAVERHMLGGRLHHYEATTRAVGVHRRVLPARALLLSPRRVENHGNPPPGSGRWGVSHLTTTADHNQARITPVSAIVRQRS
ncbi:hypothetical protein LT337_28865 [Mycolicibacterium fortuitum]|nr:hypothetical protein LT337_28865 [Mycolicibacterium fortuitum]